MQADSLFLLAKEKCSQSIHKQDHLLLREAIFLGLLLLWPARPHTIVSVTDITEPSPQVFQVTAAKWKVPPLSKTITLNLPEWLAHTIRCFKAQLS